MYAARSVGQNYDSVLELNAILLQQATTGFVRIQLCKSTGLQPIATAASEQCSQSPCGCRSNSCPGDTSDAFAFLWRICIKYNTVSRKHQANQFRVPATVMTPRPGWKVIKVAVICETKQAPEAIVVPVSGSAVSRENSMHQHQTNGSPFALRTRHA